MSYNNTTYNNSIVNSHSIGLMDSELDAKEIWDLVKVKIVNLYGEGVFRSWFRFVAFSHHDGGHIFLNTPSRFIKDWITTNYLDFIIRSWNDYDKRILAIELLVSEDEQKSQGPLIQDHATVSNLEQNESKSSHAQMGSDLTTPKYNIIDSAGVAIATSEQLKEIYFDNRFTFENFVVGKSNELAYFAARKIAETDKAIAGNNPLFLYGGVGLGKTHLMHAIANFKIEQIKKHSPNNWINKVRGKIIYLPSEKFVQEFISALSNNDMRSFKDKFRSTDIFMIDDVQFFSGKDYTQEEFFHTFNSLMDDGKQLVISADRTPGSLDGIEERIRSRLGWGLVADIGSTSYELRMGILKKKIESASVSIPDDVLDYLALNIETNVRELEGALNKVIATANLTKREINLQTVRDVLSDMIRTSKNAIINIAHIQKIVCEYFGITATEIISQNRSRNLARPRQIAMYLCKKLTSSSLSDIARKFGGKDHSTIIHGINKIEEMIKVDQEISNSINNIIGKLRQ